MEIDAIIKKAQLIKIADNPDGIDNLIASLESYKANKGDICKKKLYRMLYSGTRDSEWESCQWYPVTVLLYSLTSYIIDKLEKYFSVISQAYSCKHCLAGFVIETEDEIYNYVFDVEFYKVSRKLEILLYRNGFDIRSDALLNRNGFFDMQNAKDDKRLWHFDLSE